MVGGGGWGGVCKVIFMSNPTVVLRLGWGVDNYYFLNKCGNFDLTGNQDTRMHHYLHVWFVQSCLSCLIDLAKLVGVVQNIIAGLLVCSLSHLWFCSTLYSDD